MTGTKETLEIAPITKPDFDQILIKLDQFWGDRASETRPHHHPLYVYEFADTGLVMKEGSDVVAYLLGFALPEKAVSYIHLVGVRQEYRSRGLARQLYQTFFELVKLMGCAQVKAITSIANQGSIKFHKAMGFTLQGDHQIGDVTVVRNYSGPGQDRVVFVKKF